jgi:hypothetical protein
MSSGQDKVVMCSKNLLYSSKLTFIATANFTCSAHICSHCEFCLIHAGDDKTQRTSRPCSGRSNHTMRTIRSVLSSHGSRAAASDATMSPASIHSSEGGRSISCTRSQSVSSRSRAHIPFAAFTAAAEALEESSAVLSASLAALPTVTFNQKLLKQEAGGLSPLTALGSLSNNVCTTPGVDAVATWAAAAILQASSNNHAGVPTSLS